MSARDEGELDSLGAMIRTAGAGNRAPVDQLFTFLYRELHQLAERQLHRSGGALTLGTTTLLHEAYLNLASREHVDFPDRSRFLAYAARAMRGLRASGRSSADRSGPGGAGEDAERSRSKPRRPGAARAKCRRAAPSLRRRQLAHCRGTARARSGEDPERKLR